MGAHELNPLYWMTDGIHQFIAVKVIVSLLGVAALFYLEMQYPRRIRVCLSVLCVLYAGTLIWNACGLLDPHSTNLLYFANKTHP